MSFYAYGFEQSTSNEKAKDELKALLSQFQNLRSTFKQVVTDKEGRELQSSSGVISLVKPQKLHWEVTLPEASLLIADGKSIYNIDPFVEQVTLLDQSELTQSNPLMLLLDGNDKQWKSIEVEKKQDTYFVYPTSTDSTIVELQLQFNSKNQLYKLRSVNQQEQINALEFLKTSYNIPISSDLFNYQIKPNWVVDDQRSGRD